MYRVDPKDLIIAHDLHPEYFSSRAALNLNCAKRIPIQHHEAHIAAVMLEHKLIDEPAIGISLDGTGYGHDGTIWGGEIFSGSVTNGFKRAGSLAPVAMPGGDAAARYPVQACAAYLSKIDPKILEELPFEFSVRFRQSQSMVQKNIRTAITTSTGASTTRRESTIRSTPRCSRSRRPR